MKTLTTCAAIALTCPISNVHAGSCSYRSYGYNNYSPSYYAGNYSGYYASSYTPTYSHSYNQVSYGPTYYGYSAYHSGSYYWPGGYYSGDYHYPSGYYYAGYYDYPSNYGHSYSPVSSHCNYRSYAPPQIVQPYFLRFKAVLPLVDSPSYGSYVEQPLAGEPGTSGNGYTQAGYSTNTYAARVPQGGNYVPNAAGYSTMNAIDGKLDKLVTLVTVVTTDVGQLKSRMELVERTVGIAGASPTPPQRGTNFPPEKVPGGNPAADRPPTDTNDPMVLGPDILFKHCSACHMEDKVASSRSRVGLFLRNEQGKNEMAMRIPNPRQPNGPKVIDGLSPQVLKKCWDKIRSKEMPPAKDTAGKPLPPIPANEMALLNQFFKTALTPPQGGGTTPPQGGPPPTSTPPPPTNPPTTPPGGTPPPAPAVQDE